MSEQPWMAVDLDGTLAVYDGPTPISHIGAPIPLMVDRVKKWLAEGRRVKIFTARVGAIGRTDLVTEGYLSAEDVLQPIRAWCRKHIGQELEITNVKDLMMAELWDDRAVGVVFNTGERVEK